MDFVIIVRYSLIDNLKPNNHLHCAGEYTTAVRGRRKRGSDMAKRNTETSASPRQEMTPPEPPPFQRKLVIHRDQLIGIPLLMLLPLLGLFGFFGQTFTTERVANAELSMQVEYTTRSRYQTFHDMRVTVTNLSEQSPVTVTVTFDRSYVDQFSNTTFMPSAERLTEQVVEVELTEMETGETQAVEVEFRGEHYWHHTGMISASIAGGEAVQLPVSTTIYP